MFSFATHLIAIICRHTPSVLLCHQINKCLSAVSADNQYIWAVFRECACVQLVKLLKHPINSLSLKFDSLWKTDGKHFSSERCLPPRTTGTYFCQLWRCLNIIYFPRHRKLLLRWLTAKKKAFLCTVVYCQTVLISHFFPFKQTLTAEMWPHKYVLYDRKKDE